MKNDFLTSFFDEINKNIFENLESNSLSLYTGLSGQILFYSIYLKKNRLEANLLNFRKMIEKLFFALNNQQYNLFFCDGLVGVTFLIRHLEEEGLLEDYDYSDFLKEVDSLFLSNLKKEAVDLNKIDFLHGNLGIANYFLEFNLTQNISEDYNVYFETTTLIIENHLSRIQLNENNVELINFGLSHGLSSYLVYFTKLFKLTNENRYKQNILNIIEVYKYFFNTNKQSCFPSQGFSRGNSNYEVSLGWCYGDQTISYCIYKAGEVLGLKKIVDFSIEIVQHWSKKNSIELAITNPFYDNMFCHGLSGVAYLNKKWYQILKKESLINNYTLFMEEIVKSEKLFHKYDNMSSGYKENFCLLDGSCGLGMVIIDSLEDANLENNWDRFFLLN
ncbi:MULTISPECIES: lanthionine synthetase LanC family protein [Flavobacterium]|uniref:Lanthionine synthetase C-like protein n=1 Tax=Flavobacterium hankyongi TaxID=1176532 RepID=A0ABP8ZS16_9FLAO|nr:lanthionine synthetase LanC family protein [Flavobacterium sp. N1846]